MKLDKFFKLKNELEIFNFEKNFNSLSKTLYYFSFLGNIFLILFSYFFIKDVTNTIPNLFPGQGIFFSIFIILFMTGYELFKRFAFEQLTSTILKVKKFTFNIAIGLLVTLSLVIGSFYLGLNGAHRLVDNSENIEITTDQTISTKVDSVARYYDKEIKFYRDQRATTRADRKYRDSIVAVLQTTKDTKIKEIESKTQSKSAIKVEELKQNDFAFAVMIFFLELIILIGVAFNTYYIWTSYDEMKNLLTTPKYKQLETNIRLLKLFYQNGRKKEQEPILAYTKLAALSKVNKIGVGLIDVKAFITLCQELEIVVGTRRKKVYNVNYEKAKQLIETQEI